MQDSYSRGIPIKFDGLDATGGTLEMYHFGNSLVGISRILKNSAHFAFRHEYARRLDKPYVRILARPPQEGSYILEAVAVAQTGYPLLQPMLEDITWELITTVVGAIFLRRSGRREEMDRLLGLVHNLIEQQGIRDKGARKELVGIVHHLIDANQSAVLHALQPVGKTCASLQVGETEANAPVIDLPTVDSIRSEGELIVRDDKTYRGRLDSITLHTKSCKIELEEEEGKYYSGKMMDPEILEIENKYTKALHQGSILEFTAKALTTQDGDIKTLYISDAEITDG